MSEVIIEPVDEYDILLNEDDEVLIAIRARLGGVNRPQILYDGADKILLYRNQDQTIYLADVPEVHDESIVREYMVPLKKVERLPALDA